MRRSAVTLSTLLVSTIVGCQEPQQKEDMQDEGAQTAGMQPDFYATDPATAIPADEGYTTYPSSPTLAATTGYASSVNATGTHVVDKGDTLFRLARQYYNDERRWKDIFEANQDRVANPDMIFVGQELVIP